MTQEETKLTLRELKLNVKQEGHFAFAIILALGARSPAFNWSGLLELSSKFFSQPQTYCAPLDLLPVHLNSFCTLDFAHPI